jgi:small GTP-binding protein
MTQTIPEDEWVIKMVLCGDPGTGKTSLALRYTQQSFCITEKPTIGVGIYVQSAATAQNDYRFQIWDTSGQERFRSMLPTWFQGARVLCFLYNTNSRASFDAIPMWLAHARWAPLPSGEWGSHTNEGALGVLIGTQTDRVTYREVDAEDVAIPFAKTHNLRFAETSALTGQGIRECFDDICAQLDARVVQWPRPAMAPALLGGGGPEGDPLLKEKKKKKCTCCFFYLKR